MSTRTPGPVASVLALVGMLAPAAVTQVNQIVANPLTILEDSRRGDTADGPTAFGCIGRILTKEGRFAASASRRKNLYSHSGHSLTPKRDEEKKPPTRL